MLNYEEFKKVLKADLQEMLADMNAEIEILSVRKLNGQDYDGLKISFPDNAAAPVLYLQSLYDSYVTMGYEKVLETAGNTVRHNNIIADESVRVNIERMKNHDYAGMTDRIVFCLVNTRWNREILKDMPHREFYDLSVIYCLMFGKDEYSVKITNKLAAEMELNEEELYACARENTPQLFPLKVTGKSEILTKMGVTDPLGVPMYIIGNASVSHGAAAVLYEDVLKNLSARLDDSLYLLPSSIHEWIALPANTGDPQMLTDIVRKVNETEVSPQERLSDHVYFYDRTINLLTGM